MKYIKQYKKDLREKKRLEKEYKYHLENILIEIFGTGIKYKKTNIFGYKIKVPILSVKSNLYNFLFKADNVNHFKSDVKITSFEGIQQEINNNNFKVSVEELNISIDHTISEEEFNSIKDKIITFHKKIKNQHEVFEQILRDWQIIHSRQLEYYPRYFIEDKVGVEFEYFLPYLQKQVLFGWVPFYYGYTPHYHSFGEKGRLEQINKYQPLLRIKDNNIDIIHRDWQGIILHQSIKLNDFFNIYSSECFLYDHNIKNLLGHDPLNIINKIFIKDQYNKKIKYNSKFELYFSKTIYPYIKEQLEKIYGCSNNDISKNIQIREELFGRRKLYQLIERSNYEVRTSNYPVSRLSDIKFRKMNTQEIFAYIGHNYFRYDLFRYLKIYHSELKIGDMWKKVDHILDGIELGEPELGQLIREAYQKIK